jgi:hypothetical protein
MQKTLATAVALFAMASALADTPAQEHPAVKRAFSVPPSADLAYSIKARQKGITISGDAQLAWRSGEGKYSLTSESRASILGKLLENRSNGSIDNYGIAPVQFYEKRFRKAPYTVNFDRAAKVIRFTDGEETYPIKGGEQDRGTVPWQLASVARAAPDKFSNGSEWPFFVAGRKDAAPWVFKVVGRETVKTGVGDLETVHLSRTPPEGSRDQKLDIWLAPAQEWYPARIRLTDDDDVIEQTLEKVNKKPAG